MGSKDVNFVPGELNLQILEIQRVKILEVTVHFNCGLGPIDLVEDIDRAVQVFLYEYQAVGFPVHFEQFEFLLKGQSHFMDKGIAVESICGYHRKGQAHEIVEFFQALEDHLDQSGVPSVFHIQKLDLSPRIPLPYHGIDKGDDPEYLPGQ